MDKRTVYLEVVARVVENVDKLLRVRGETRQSFFNKKGLSGSVLTTITSQLRENSEDKREINYSVAFLSLVSLAEALDVDLKTLMFEDIKLSWKV